MSKYCFRIGIALVVFVFGILSVNIADFFFRKPFEKLNVEEVELAITKIQTEQNDFDPWRLPKDFPPLKQGEFFLVGQACGNGFSQGWLAYDNSRLSVGFIPKDSFDFKEEIANAVEIFERKENFINKDGKKGLRIVLRGKNKESGKEYYEVIWYNKKLGAHYIAGPNLKIALELEAFLNSQN